MNTKKMQIFKFYFLWWQICKFSTIDYLWFDGFENLHFFGDTMNKSDQSGLLLFWTYLNFALRLASDSQLFAWYSMQCWMIYAEIEKSLYISIYWLCIINVDDCWQLFHIYMEMWWNFTWIHGSVYTNFERII